MGRKKSGTIVVWMKLSDPVYQLPEIVADSAVELARMCGVTKNTIGTSWHRLCTGEAKYSRYIMVEVSDDDDAD